LTIVFLKDFPGIQVMLLISSSLWMLLYQVGVRPYGVSALKDVYTFLEMWNEATLITVGYIMVPLVLEVDKYDVF